jgi:hypothetical protein
LQANLFWTSCAKAVVSRQQLLLTGGSVAAGYVMASSFLFGGAAPFGAAFCAALPWKYVCAAALGSVLGHIFTPAHLAGMKYIAAVLLVVVFKWLLSQKMLRLNAAAGAIASSFFGMFLASALLVFTMNFTLYDILSSGLS